MFCSNCGKADQVAESYCRSCGEFLADLSGKTYLMNKLLGGQKPETQVTVNLVINVVTALISSLLLGFLNGYYDALNSRTGESPPSVIYPVYIFLGAVTLWQLLSFLIGLRLRAKLKRRTQTGASNNSTPELVKTAPPRSLRESKLDPIPTSITEDKTRILDPVTRK